MKFMHRHSSLEEDEFADPMSGVANLFDTAVVFISALLLVCVIQFELRLEGGFHVIRLCFRRIFACHVEQIGGVNSA